MKYVQLQQLRDGYSIDTVVYETYINENAQRFKPGVRAFTLLPSKFEHRSTTTFHDSHLLSVNIEEGQSESGITKTGVKLSVIMPSGDRALLHYTGVSRYIFSKRKTEWPHNHESHGDWLVDELIEIKPEIYRHEIIFTDARLILIHSDLEFYLNNKLQIGQ